MGPSFPLWINEIPALTALQRTSGSPLSQAPPSATPSSSAPSLVSIRDLFRCDVSDPQECWDYVLLSSYMTDLEWLLTAVPELSAVASKVVVLSGSKGTATLRRSDAGVYLPTPDAMNRVNSFLGALHTVAQRRRSGRCPPSSPVSPSTSLPVLTHERFAAIEPPLPIAFGTHHTKMAVCVNRRGVRVCIFTANLLEQDWCWKTQGVYMQDFPWAATPRPHGGPKACEFEAQLRHYWTHCGLNMTTAFSWEASSGLPLGLFNTDFLSHVDFTEARVWLVSSVPGTHAGGEASPGYRVGLCRLAEVLRNVSPSPSREAPVVLTWQYSSQGSLNPTFVNTLQAAMCGAADLAGVAVTKADGPCLAPPAAVREVQVIYPTEAEVRRSLEGWRGGASLPVRLQSCHEFVNERLHRWGSQRPPTAPPRAPHAASTQHSARECAVDVDASDTEGLSGADAPEESACMAADRQYAMPHIKSYASMDAARTHLHWYLLTSANLSQAAWGSLSGKATKTVPRRLLVRSYELGVLYDGTSIVDTSAPSSWFSVVREPCLRLPTAANSALTLFATPVSMHTKSGSRGSSDVSEPLLYLPCDMLSPEPYASTAALRAHRCSSSAGNVSQPPLSALSCRDVPWVIDIPHGGLDAYGRDVEEAFSADTLPPLSHWRPGVEDDGAGVARGDASRKRTRER